MERREQRSLSLSLAAITGISLFYTLRIHPPWDYRYADMAGYISRAAAYAHREPLTAYDSLFPIGLTYLYAPAFLASQEVAFRLLAVGQALAFTGSCFATYSIAQSVTGNRAAAWVALVLTATFYPLFAFSGFYLAETYFTLFLLTGVALLLRSIGPKSSVTATCGAGIAFGIAAVTKSSLYPFLILACLCVPFLLPRTHRWIRLWGFWVGLATVITLQATHLSIALRRPTFLPTNSGLNLYLGQAEVRSVRNQPVDGTWVAFVNNNSATDSSLQTDAFFTFPAWESGPFRSLIQQRWHDDPASQARIVGKNSAYLFSTAPHWPLRNEPRSSAIDATFLRLFTYGLLPLAVLGGARIWRSERNGRRSLAILLTPIGSLILSSALTLGENRYLVPFIPLILICTATGAVALSSWRPEHRLLHR